jgi:hypothetical protein
MNRRLADLGARGEMVKMGLASRGFLEDAARVVFSFSGTSCNIALHCVASERLGLLYGRLALRPRAQDPSYRRYSTAAAGVRPTDGRWAFVFKWRGEAEGR